MSVAMVFLGEKTADGMHGYQVKLKVAIRSHEADARQLHQQIECLSDSRSESSSVASPGTCRRLHLDVEVKLIVTIANKMLMLTLLCCRWAIVKPHALPG